MTQLSFLLPPQSESAGNGKRIKLVLGKFPIQGFKGDAVVNATNRLLQHNPRCRCVDTAIHEAAGPRLELACKQVPVVEVQKDNRGATYRIRCPTGEARLVGGFDMDVNHIIMVAGPVYAKYTPVEAEKLLAKTYRSAFTLASEHKLKKIALPAISCGSFGFPLDRAAEISLAEACAVAGGGLEEVHFSLFGPGTFNAWLEAAVSMGLDPEGEQPPAPAPIHAQVPKLPAGDIKGVWQFEVFISHAGEDKRFARDLKRDMSRLGIRAFVDQDDLRGADAADEVMKGAASTSPIGLAIFSPEYFAKKWPMLELKIMMENKRLLPTLTTRVAGFNHEAFVEELRGSKEAHMSPEQWDAFVKEVTRITHTDAKGNDELALKEVLCWDVVRLMTESVCPKLAEGHGLQPGDVQQILQRVAKAAAAIAAEDSPDFELLTGKHLNLARKWKRDLDDLEQRLKVGDSLAHLHV